MHTLVDDVTGLDWSRLPTGPGILDFWSSETRQVLRPMGLVGLLNELGIGFGGHEIFSRRGHFHLNKPSVFVCIFL